jgi:hypothetical protein
MSAELGMGATAWAAEVGSAIEALDFETEPPSKLLPARLRRDRRLTNAVAGCMSTRLYVYCRI